ncbi:MAG: DUF2848 family protein [Deltaproteobacteria bacterium]|nr:DUF2848 family protein [Deltaproteobacteria bacterium]
MATLTLTLVREGRSEPVIFEVRRLVNGGFTSRDQSGARKHIEELKAKGITCPDEIPAFYPKSRELITTADEIEVLGDQTSGEAEFALLIGGGRTLVAVGSDHTDRELEALTIPKSKMVCPNVVSREVWDLQDVRQHWDSLLLRSYMLKGGERTRYQEARLGSMLPPEQILDLAKGRISEGGTEGLVLFSGTVAAIGGLSFGDGFEAELVDEVWGRRLTCQYRVRPITWFRSS